MAPVPTPAALKVLDIFSRLQTVPRQEVSFRLSDDEVNQYLVYALLKMPRPGIDFDAIERWSPGLVPGFSI